MMVFLGRLHATKEQLESLAEVVVSSMSLESEKTFGMGNITRRLLRRADFFELRGLQGVLWFLLNTCRGES